MTTFLIIITFLVFFTLNFLFYRFLYLKFGKSLINFAKTLENTSKIKQNTPKQPIITHFQSELNKINTILEEYRKKQG